MLPTPYRFSETAKTGGIARGLLLVLLLLLLLLLSLVLLPVTPARAQHQPRPSLQEGRHGAAGREFHPCPAHCAARPYCLSKTKVSS